MASSKLTLIGLYNYDNSIFDNMLLPNGIEKDTLVDNILLNCGEFETLYPDTNFLKGAISIWSKKWYRTIDKWINALSIEYDPLNNYDRTETWSDTSRQDSTGQRNDTNSETIANDITNTHSETIANDTTNTHSETIANDTTNTHSETITEDTTKTHTSTGSATDISSGSSSGESENTISAFDSNSYVPHDKNTNSNTTSNNSTSNTTADGKDTENNKITRNGTDTVDNNITRNGTDTVDNDITRNGTDTVDNDITRNGNNSSTSTENITNTSSHTGRMFGNIGVTTSQQMLQSELNLAKWNLYEHITDIFAKEFCIMIY